MVEKKMMSEEEVKATVDNLILDALNEYYIAYYKACYLNEMVNVLFKNTFGESSRKKQDKTRFIMTAIDKLFE